MADPVLPAQGPLQTARPREWPPTGTPLMLVLGRRQAGHRSEALGHDLDRGLIELAEPRVAGERIRADRADLVTVTWTSSQGIHALRTRLVDVHPKAGVWAVEPASHVAVVDRRRYQRVPASSTAEVTFASGEAHDMILVDICEGGCRCRTSQPAKAGTGAALSAALRLDGGDLAVSGKVAWHRLVGRDCEFGIAFAKVARRDLAKLRELLTRGLAR